MEREEHWLPSSKPPKPKVSETVKSPAQPKSTKANSQGSPKPATTSGPKAKAELKIKSEPKAKAEPKIKPEPKVKKEPKLSSPARREPKIKKEASLSEDPNFEVRQAIDPGTRNITGVYNIFSAQIEEQLPDSAGNLRLFLCVDNENNRIWGGFELAMKYGVIRIDEIDLYKEVSFGWRARDSWEGRKTRFGRGCFGDIELYGHEEVRGTFYNLFNEPMQFEGRRRPGPLWCGRSAYSFQQEWDGFVSQAYGR